MNIDLANTFQDARLKTNIWKNDIYIKCYYYERT